MSTERVTGLWVSVLRRQLLQTGIQLGQLGLTHLVSLGLLVRSQHLVVDLAVDLRLLHLSCDIICAAGLPAPAPWPDRTRRIGSVDRVDAILRHLLHQGTIGGALRLHDGLDLRLLRVGQVQLLGQISHVAMAMATPGLARRSLRFAAHKPSSPFRRAPEPATQQQRSKTWSSYFCFSFVTVRLSNVETPVPRICR